MVRGLEAILKPAQEAVKFLEGDDYPTAHLIYPVLGNLHDAWKGIVKLEMRSTFGEGLHEVRLSDLNEHVQAAAAEMVSSERWCCCHDA